MRLEMKMPDLATTDSQIRVVRWYVESGQKVTRGQPLLEVETDKATMEVESVASGVLHEVKAKVNDEVSVGQVIAVLEVEEVVRSAIPNNAAPTFTAAQAVSVPTAVASTGSVAQPQTADRPKGLFARNRSAVAPSAPSQQESIPLSVAARTAAKRLQESKQTAPHFYLQTSFNAAAVIAKRDGAASIKPAWDAFFVLAIARAINKFDRFCYRFDGNRLIRIASDGIGVAIDHEGELYVIPVASPTTKTVEQISEEIRRNVAGLHDGDPEIQKIRPAIMTVTNLGVTNVESVIPIINPPEAAILGIGKVLPTPVAQANGQVSVEQRATLTLSVDHRVVSGKYAGEFLSEIVKMLETV